ncbi:HAD family hydrolase [Pseudomarimonas salicorniae]|uniref:HAD family hydrolase n=1 Tax=Pseudomarimonas salicorniae TaxID=2933270 RepID=A0ABT0GG16_9GAMM|nr:HAD family hydrolase [Lysobacter sp. CAU 1642]MCK7593483.1 HAD family hydrolase [Lysobacter sp. CAU 1642]
MLQMVGFDADDTLWRSQEYFDAAQAEFESILAAYLDIHDRRVHEELLATERRNIRLYGYGAKGMTLSMLETAIALTAERISAADLHRVLAIGRSVLEHPVELLPGVREAVEEVGAEFEVVLITKGDLFHQERKVAESGLGSLFRRIEIVSEKDEASYARLLREFDLPAERFAMVGNSLRSDIEPVLNLGGAGVHVPYSTTWALETEHAVDEKHPRLRIVQHATEIAATLRELAAA